MSLQIWLPLTGHLNNQGLSGITVTSSGATVSDDGKIGKCYYFDGSDDYINLGNIGYYFDGSAFSICFWIKSLESGTRGCIFSSYKLPSTSEFFSLEINSGTKSDNSLRFDWRNEDIFYSDANIFAVNEWEHICVTYDGSGNIITYKNGNLAYTKTYTLPAITVGNTYYLGRDARTGSTAFNGYLNDFRIYDHALSPKEVAEIAKGLVLHYKLDREGFGTDNLIYYHDHNLNHNSNNGSTYPISREWLTENGIEYEHITRTNTTSNPTVLSIYGNGYKTALDPSLTAGMTVTVSLWARCSHNQNNTRIYYSEVSKGTSVTGNIIPMKANQWTQLYLTRELTISYADYNATGRSFDICVSGISIPSGEIDNFWFDIRTDYMIVVGSTPPLKWIPSKYDPKYTALGLNETTVCDVSGYGNNGTIVNGGISYSNDTPCYNVSTEFDGVTSAISIPWNTFYKQGEVFTINIWWKKSGLGSKNYETLFGGSGIEMDTRAGSASTLSLYMATTRGGNLYTSLNFNEWYMNTLVNDGTNELYYINGQLVKTIEKKNMPTGTCYIGAWNSPTSQNYKGLISNFKIYKTALTEDQILQLYNTPISLANNGTLFAGEFVET